VTQVFDVVVGPVIIVAVMLFVGLYDVTDDTRLDFDGIARAIEL
jgi:hypothetical protein